MQSSSIASEAEMGAIIMTSHAKVRSQQRGIPSVAIEMLMDYGAVRHDHRGAEVIYFNKQARERIRRAETGIPMKEIEPFLGIYAVLKSDGAVVTVGHRTRRLP
jgi:hypothetical protein